MNQSSNERSFYLRLFEQGVLFNASLFLDFEDWRPGTRGLTWSGSPPLSAARNVTTIDDLALALPGAHFWPFNDTSIVVSVPAYLHATNEGLVLDRATHLLQIELQAAFADDVKGRLDWIDANIESINMGAELRARRDVRLEQELNRNNVSQWYAGELAELVALNSSQCTYQVCELLFNTSSLELTGAVNATGVLRLTANGTEVALFAFDSVYLGPEVGVTLVGQRALVLSSRTSIVLNTTMAAAPGTLGGMQGGGSVARLANESLVDGPRLVMICDLLNVCDNSHSFTNFTDEERNSFISNNVNGPGSGNVRVYPFVVRTAAAVISEVQFLRTSARPSQTMAGGFVLSFKAYQTPVIPHDVTSIALKQLIEANLNGFSPSDTHTSFDRRGGPLAGVGVVEVTRSIADSQEGFEWLITFTSAIGNVDQLQVASYLQGLGASVETGTVLEGNEIGGFFTLQFNGATSEPIQAAETASSFQRLLLAMPSVSSAFVERIDPTGLCDDGLCQDGPMLSRGLLWTVFVTANEEFGNASPYSPTSPQAQANVSAASISVDYASLTGVNAVAEVALGLSSAPDDRKSLLSLTSPFSLAFGGAGGSFGGRGGSGYGVNDVGSVYGSDSLRDLLGGSGGCMRGIFPFETNAYGGISVGKGGAGGGAVELIAINDITIGSFGKLLLRGGDGEQTSEGGGGGGSGGAALLSAGGVVVNEGAIDVGGGGGAYGGNYTAGAEVSSTPVAAPISGGGGGGGRIALFGESIVNRGALSVTGGDCGVLLVESNRSVSVVSVSVQLQSPLPLSDARLEYIVRLHLESVFPDIHHVNTTLFSSTYSNTTFTASIDQLVFLTHLDANISAVLASISNSSSFSLVGVAITAMSVQGLAYANITVTDLLSTPCSNRGGDGRLYTEARFSDLMRVEETSGAEGTSRALRLSSNNDLTTASGVLRESPFTGNGPIVSFPPSQPSRLTYYTRMSSIEALSAKSNYGSLVTFTCRHSACSNVSSVVGVFVGSSIMHGSNYQYSVDDRYFYKTMIAIDEYPVLDEWYKVDVHMNWLERTYYILLNDVLVVKDQPFSGDSIDGLHISTFYNVDVWIDEVYIGLDSTMHFKCPESTSTNVQYKAGISQSWFESEVDESGTNGRTQLQKMSRHYSFFEPANTLPFDGQGNVKFFQDYSFKQSFGANLEQGKLHPGALLFLSSSQRSGQTPRSAAATTVSQKGGWWKSNPHDKLSDGRQFWYSEYEHASNISASLNGGVCACSSQDTVTWRFEGIVFHYTNLSDVVYGSAGPFHIEKPKVLFNNKTNMFVLWGILENTNRSLASAVVLSSASEDGPFFYRRSLYPDGNSTRDQGTRHSIFVLALLLCILWRLCVAAIYTSNDRGTLSRTYYQTVEYVLPQAMMQPVWESVKLRNGQTNYRNNFHRTHYEVGYDNYHDIFLQRWRKEDKPWEVLCVDHITKVERSVPKGVYNSDGSICDAPREYKVVVGQGQQSNIRICKLMCDCCRCVGSPYVKSNYVDPRDLENSWWMQSSVPAVHAQPWNSSYQDGLCGISEFDGDVDELDPNLVNYVPKDRGNCSNVADNPIHAAVQDKLIGIQKVVSRRRAKFIAISGLTSDFMDTSGFLSSFEGELQGESLMSLMNDVGDFGFTSDETIRSTFAPPVMSEYKTADDYKTRFRQYIRQHNDRAFYSLACLIDGVCPVDYKSQITEGHV